MIQPSQISDHILGSLVVIVIYMGSFTDKLLRLTDYGVRYFFFMKVLHNAIFLLGVQNNIAVNTPGPGHQLHAG
ncbi:hypothetical protein D3C81_1982680 [compost metagenome]